MLNIIINQIMYMVLLQHYIKGTLMPNSASVNMIGIQIERERSKIG